MTTEEATDALRLLLDDYHLSTRKTLFAHLYFPGMLAALVALAPLTQPEKDELLEIIRFARHGDMLSEVL